MPPSLTESNRALRESQIRVIREREEARLAQVSALREQFNQ